jgi:hypothetical protein
MTSYNGGCVAPAQRSRRLALDVSLVTLREGWSQLCGLTGIAQRRLDRCIHSYTHRFRFIAACDGNEDKSYGTEPKDQIHPMQKSQFHRKNTPSSILVRCSALHLRLTGTPRPQNRNGLSAICRQFAARLLVAHRSLGLTLTSRIMCC